MYEKHALVAYSLHCLNVIWRPPPLDKTTEAQSSSNPAGPPAIQGRFVSRICWGAEALAPVEVVDTHNGVANVLLEMYSVHT